MVLELVFDEDCFTEFVSDIKEGLVVVITFMEFSVSGPFWGVHIQNVEGIEL